MPTHHHVGEVAVTPVVEEVVAAEEVRCALQIHVTPNCVRTIRIRTEIGGIGALSTQLPTRAAIRVGATSARLQLRVRTSPVLITATPFLLNTNGRCARQVAETQLPASVSAFETLAPFDPMA